MKYITVMLKMVKKVEDAHAKKLSLVGTLPAKIRVKTENADSGTYMNRHGDGKDIENVWKNDGSWYWLVKS